MRGLLLHTSFIVLAFWALGCGDDDGPGKAETCKTFEPFDGAIPADTTLDGCYLITGHITVPAGVRLTIAPGSVLKFEDDRSLEVEEGGELVARGTQDDPILLTGDTQSPGSWRGVLLHNSDSPDNAIDHLTIEYAGGYDWAMGARAGLALTSTGTLVSAAISNTTLRDNDGYGLFLARQARLSAFDGNTLTRNSAGAAQVGADAVAELSDRSSYAGNTVDIVAVIGGSSITHSQTWPAVDVPYLVDGTVHVDTVEDMTLTIAAGATLQFDTEAGLEIADGGALTAIGTGAAKITFTRANGIANWRGLHIHNANSSANQLDHVVVEYGGGYSFASGAPADIALTSTGYPARLSLKNSTVRKSAGYGVWVDSNASLTESDNTYSDNATTPDVFYEQ